MNQPRRNFIKTIGKLAVAGAMADVVLLTSACVGARYVSYETASGGIRINRSEFANDVFLLVKPAEMQTPIYIRKINNDEFSAVLLQCTHRGCEVNPTGDILVCPCHGSEYSIRGDVLHPPAEKDLKRYPVQVETDTLFVELY